MPCAAGYATSVVLVMSNKTPSLDINATLPLRTVIAVSDVVPKNAEPLTLVRDVGSSILSRFPQPENAKSPMLSSTLFPLNATV